MKEGQSLDFMPEKDIDRSNEPLHKYKSRWKKYIYQGQEKRLGPNIFNDVGNKCQ